MGGTPPGLDGFQLLNLIRRRSSVPIIIITGKREANTAADALRLGADDYLRKPFYPQELLARIAAKLRRVGTEIPDCIEVSGSPATHLGRKSTIRPATSAEVTGVASEAIPAGRQQNPKRR